jgi:hypothetical protein
MKKRIFKTFSIIVLALGFIIPALPTNAWGGYYTFRSTVAGAGINKINDSVYHISDERYDFDKGESVYALTRIFNVTNVTSFRFKHEITGNNFYQAGESPIFRPNRSWWQEVYYWYNFDNLPAGDYDLISSIQIDGDCYKQLKSVHITIQDNRYRTARYNNNNNRNNNHGYYNPNVRNIGNYNYSQTNYRTDNYNGRYQRQPQYIFGWTQTGKGIRDLGNNTYEIINQTGDFNTNESVYSLTRINNIRDINTFKVKNEIYKNGNVYKTDETAELKPSYNYWDNSFIRSNLGRLPNGKYELRVSISINGGVYTQLTTKPIAVGRDCAYNDYSCYNYKYDWSRTDQNIRQISTYSYDTINPKSEFYTDENVKVLTKLGNINGIDRFKIRHELYKDNYSQVRTIDSDERQPRNSNWDYNYTTSDFGRLSVGSYSIKIYISINGGYFQYLDTKNISVKDRNTYSNYNNNSNYQNYNYEGTIIGTDNNYYQNRQYNN